MDAAGTTYADRFEAIVAIAADAIISVDESHRITLFNKGAEEIFGYAAHEILGAPLDALIPERFRPNHSAHIQQFAESGMIARRMGERREIYGLRKGGIEFPAEASISKIEVEGGWVFTVVLRDISDRKRLEEERSRLLELERNARVLAERAAQLRDEVLGVVSHDLRNPLSVISMCASGLNSDARLDHAQVRELSQTIQDAASWMQRLIRDLLDVANIDSGKLSLERKPVDLVITIMKAADLFEHLAREKFIKILVDLPDHMSLAHADSDRIIQVLSNLMGNALKFTKVAGTVTIRAVESGSEVTVSIADSGSGIPEDDVPHIFDRFWHARRASSVRGTGLGLAIAKGIIAAHGGRIWVESTPDIGSTFHFSVPVAN